MEVLNRSRIVDFTFIGFSLSSHLKILTFFLVLISYCFILIANATIIMVVKKHIQLHTPMYIFLSNFSLLEIGCTSVVIPKLLVDLLSTKCKISSLGCMMQFYFVLFSGAMENILLAMMGYDRYLAICHPLHYHSIMTPTLCYAMSVLSWVASSIISLLPAVLVSMLHFCGKRDIDHFFCDFGPLEKLSCSDTTVAARSFYAEACILILSCSSVTAISYIYIISAVLKIQTNKGRQKAFSTCASHLCIVGVFYGTLSFLYIRPSSGNTSTQDKIMSLFYTIVTPLLNPIIYSLRNESIKTSIKNLINGKL